MLFQVRMLTIPFHIVLSLTDLHFRHGRSWGFIYHGWGNITRHLPSSNGCFICALGLCQRSGWFCYHQTYARYVQAYVDPSLFNGFSDGIQAQLIPLNIRGCMQFLPWSLVEGTLLLRVLVWLVLCRLDILQAVSYV